MINSCSNNQNCNRLSYGVLRGKVQRRAIYPLLGGIEFVETETPRKSLAVRVNMTVAGTVSCRAFGTDEDLYPRKVADVGRVGEGSNARSGATTAVTHDPCGAVLRLEMQDLEPDTVYDVYCYTEDFGGYGMDVPAVLATKLSNKTECCAEAFFFDSPSVIISARGFEDMNFESKEYTFNVGLDASPRGTVFVTVGVRLCGFHPAPPSCPNSKPDRTSLCGYGDMTSMNDSSPVIADLFENRVTNFFSDIDLTVQEFTFTPRSPVLAASFGVFGREVSHITLSFASTLHLTVTSNQRIDPN